MVVLNAAVCVNVGIAFVTVVIWIAVGAVMKIYAARFVFIWTVINVALGVHYGIS